MNEGAGDIRVGVRRRWVVDVGVCVFALGVVAGRVVDMGVGWVWDWVWL